MDLDQKIFTALTKYVPEGAAAYCWNLWKEKPFHFFITKSRQTKLGDFRYRMDKKIQTITINHDLNIYQFLITYIHEVAHYRTYEKFGAKVKPHGLEWKKTFQSLLTPVLNEQVLPIDLLIPLRRYVKNPLASTMSDPFLAREVVKYNKKGDALNKTFLFQLASGTPFVFRGRKFQKEEMRRTRVLCLEIHTGKKYLISSHAEVKVDEE
jgi:hypothetical protein